MDFSKIRLDSSSEENFNSSVDEENSLQNNSDGPPDSNTATTNQFGINFKKLNSSSNSSDSSGIHSTHVDDKNVTPYIEEEDLEENEYIVGEDGEYIDNTEFNIGGLFNKKSSSVEGNNVYTDNKESLSENIVSSADSAGEKSMGGLGDSYYSSSEEKDSTVESDGFSAANKESFLSSDSNNLFNGGTSKERDGGEFKDNNISRVRGGLEKDNSFNSSIGNTSLYTVNEDAEENNSIDDVSEVKGASGYSSVSNSILGNSLPSNPLLEDDGDDDLSGFAATFAAASSLEEENVENKNNVSSFSSNIDGEYNSNEEGSRGEDLNSSGGATNFVGANGSSVALRFGSGLGVGASAGVGGVSTGFRETDDFEAVEAAEKYSREGIKLGAVRHVSFPKVPKFLDDDDTDLKDVIRVPEGETIVSCSVGSDGIETIEFSGGGSERRVAPMTETVDEEDLSMVRKRNLRSIGLRRTGSFSPELTRLKKFTGSVVYEKASRAGSMSPGVATFRGPKEVLVNEDGILFDGVGSGDSVVRSSAEFAALVDAAEKGSEVKVGGDVLAAAESGERAVGVPKLWSSKVIYPWSSPAERVVTLNGGRVRASKAKFNERELDFFRGLKLGRREVLADADVTAQSRGGAAGSKAARKAAVRAATGFSDASYSRGEKYRGGLTVRDIEVLEFLARFRYVTAGQVASIFGVLAGTASNRLAVLAKKGLVECIPLGGRSPMWVVTRAGMVVSGFELPVIKPDRLSYQLVPHQFCVNHVAANLMGGRLNVLALPDFPAENRFENGEWLRGEEVVSEVQIQSSFGRFRGTKSGEVFRPLADRRISGEFSAWQDAGGSAAGLDSPEFAWGNEWMWVLFPPSRTGRVYHVPDLVVRRRRDSQSGAPRCIAVEVEAMDAPKPVEGYEKVLACYQADDKMFGKVVWVCKTLANAKRIETAARNIGFWDSGRVDVVPVITKDGFFMKKDLWLLDD